MPCTVRTVGAGDRVASEFSRLAGTGGKHVRTSTHFLKDERIYRPARKTNT